MSKFSGPVISLNTPSASETPKKEVGKNMHHTTSIGLSGELSNLFENECIENFQLTKNFCKREFGAVRKILLLWKLVSRS